MGGEERLSSRRRLIGSDGRKEVGKRKRQMEERTKERMGEVMGTHRSVPSMDARGDASGSS